MTFQYYRKTEQSLKENVFSINSVIVMYILFTSISTYAGIKIPTIHSGLENIVVLISFIPVMLFVAIIQGLGVKSELTSICIMVFFWAISVIILLNHAKWLQRSKMRANIFAIINSLLSFLFVNTWANFRISW